MLWLLIIIGSISSIVGNMVFEEYGYNGVEVVDFAVGAFFLEISSWALYSFIEYFVYRIVAMLINSLADIVQNTYISANTALFCASRSFDRDVEETTVVQPVSASVNNEN